LKAQLEQLEKDGWTIKLDPSSSSYYTDFPNKEIVINGARSAQVRRIAHEVGHATTGNPYVPDTPSMTRDQYVNTNIESHMVSEGKAQLNATIVRDEIRRAGGTDPGLPGTQTPA